jgi:hypothetical protein
MPPKIALNEANSRVGAVGLRKPFDFEELFSIVVANLVGRQQWE